MEVNQKHVWNLITVPGLAIASLLLAFFWLGQSTVGAKPSNQPGSNFTISGTVTSLTSGSVLSDVEVFVWNRDQGSGFVGDTTDISGTYEMTLATGNYDLSFNPPAGSGYASSSYKGLVGPPDITLNIALTDGYTISGTVYAGSTLSTVGNTAIYAYNRNTADGLGLPPTNSGGHYSIGLVAGAYDLSFTPPACTNPRLGPRTDIITVTQNMVHDVFLPPGFTVAGCISDGSSNPVSGVQIYAYDPLVGGFGFAPSNASGCYTGTLPLGAFDIQFIPPAGRGLGPLTVIDAISQTTSCPNTSLPITLLPGVTISGTVTCRQPLKNVFVYADPAGPPVPGNDLPGWGLYTVEDGSYQLPVVPGVYTFTFVPPAMTCFETKIITNIQVSTDTLLNVNLCPIYMPIVVKNYLQS